MRRCGGDCVQTDTDHKHCGGCDKACAAGLDCVASSCVCLVNGRCTGCCAGADCVLLTAQSTQRCGSAGAACATCTDSFACTIESCNAGACTSEPDQSHCLIQATCIADKSVDPKNGCQRCDRGVSPYGWNWFFAKGCVETVAGSIGGFKDGPLNVARFFHLAGIAMDSAGAMYLADYHNYAIRKVAAGQVTTSAGDGKPGYQDGPAAKARFRAPNGIAVDAAGRIFVADTKNHAIRLVDGGVVSTFAGDGVAGHKDGPIAATRFNLPMGLALDAAGTLYVTDYDNYRVRKISGGVVSTLAGDGTAGYKDGPASSARFRGLQGIALGPTGVVYVTDVFDSRIRKISSGVVTTVAGSGAKGYKDGPAGSAAFDHPQALVVTAAGDVIVADSFNHVLRKISGGVVTTVTGTGTKGHLDGPELKALLDFPSSLMRSAAGTIYFGEMARLRRYAP
jgi:NHL repeat